MAKQKKKDRKRQFAKAAAPSGEIPEQQVKKELVLEPPVRQAIHAAAHQAFTLTFVVSLAIYLKTVAPSVVGGDTGELLAEACQLGTPHPPGYPLYTMLVYAATRLGRIVMGESASPAYLANCLSCLLGALASGLIATSVVLLAEFRRASPETVPMNTWISRAAGVAAGLSHTLSPLTWQYSVTAEVFALHNFLMALLLYNCICFSMNQTSSFLLYSGAYLCGLALTNQHTSILLEIPIVLYVIYRAKLLESPQKLAAVSGWFFLGLALYLYLPLSAIYHPHAGAWGDVSTFSGMIRHMSRKDYGSLQLFSGDGAEDEKVWDRTYAWLLDFSTVQTNQVVALVGLFSGLKIALNFFRDAAKNRDQHPADLVSTVLLAAGVFYVVVFYSLSNIPMDNPLMFGVLKRFWMPPNIICFLLVGIGIADLGVRLKRNKDDKFLDVATGLVSAVIVLFAFWMNITKSDQSDNYHYYHYGRSMLDMLPEKSLLIASADPDWNTVRYLQECENLRRDVTTINLSYMTNRWWEKQQLLFPNVDSPGSFIVKGDSPLRLNEGFTISQLVDANYDSFGGKVFLTLDLGRFTEIRFHELYEKVPLGLVKQIVRKSELSLTAEDYRKQSLEAWRVVAGHMVKDLPDRTKYDAETWENWLREQFFEKMQLRAEYMLNLGNMPQASPEAPTLHSAWEAIAWLELVVAHYEDLKITPTIKKNLGIGYLNMQRNKEEAYTELPPVIDDIFAEANNTAFMHAIDLYWWRKQGVYKHWKDWAGNRWHTKFGEYLAMADAKDDPEYEKLKNFYESTILK